MAGRSILRIFRIVILLSLAFSVIHYLISKKTFVFSARDVKKIAEKFVGQHPSTSLPKLLNEFRRPYGGHMIPPSDPNWFTLSAGGLKTKLYLIHMSVTEYMAVIGSPMSTSGHAGFHWMNQSCSVLTGSVQRWKDGPQLTREDFGPGDHVRFAMFENSIVELSDDAWLLCYGRGFVPTSSFYVTFESLTSCADPWSPAQILFVSARSMVREYVQMLVELYHYYSGKFFSK